MTQWIARAFQGSIEDVQNARNALQQAIETGIYTGHQIDLIRPSINEPPGPPAIMQEGQATFGFAIAKGVEYETPPGCIEINPHFSAIVLGLGGIQYTETEY